MPEVMFVWGNNPIVANSDGFFGHWVIDLQKRGMKTVVIDPRITFLASKADLYLPIRPGTDAALALGMLNVVINEDLYDHEFVDLWCYGFDALAERVQSTRWTRSPRSRGSRPRRSWPPPTCWPSPSRPRCSGASPST